VCRLQDYFDQSLDEIKLLRYVNNADPDDEHHIVRLYEFFYYKVRPAMGTSRGGVMLLCLFRSLTLSLALTQSSLFATESLSFSGFHQEALFGLHV
jgi:hypothetical protein